ncbi:hypothetical protein AbraIFM66951_005850 [Aspergillus brasiliensis]|uniref:Uncharacterized protein n=1 Tax=Aspergillus brasiliensis TaxID=319629 RepID=A0A9W6DM58_9EURO|nr:hypothetical protein AbraCBS73388_006103 [Aspergillus brasiliensis]GKZ44074.1 hypothetical protein AbraIFM66951_005850 [Aspergillus brasiliensis]
MSSTTTTTTAAVEASTLSILSDYEIHHTGSETQPQSQAARDSTPTVSQPVDWPSHYRRIPSYRPVNRNLSYEERTAGMNAAEYVFIQSMLHGVWLNASVSRLWRFTGGRINDKIFYYDIGGEW